MASKIVQPEFFPKPQRSHEEIMLGMIKGLFARDKQRDQDIEKLMSMIMDSEKRIDETKQQINNIVAYDSKHRF
jgi:hypothetical protein